MENEIKHAVNQMARSALSEIMVRFLIEYCERGHIDQHAAPSLQMLLESLIQSQNAMEKIIQDSLDTSQ